MVTNNRTAKPANSTAAPSLSAQGRTDAWPPAVCLFCAQLAKDSLYRTCAKILALVTFFLPAHLITNKSTLYIPLSQKSGCGGQERRTVRMKATSMEGSADSSPTWPFWRGKIGSRAIFTVTQLPGQFKLVQDHKSFLYGELLKQKCRFHALK